MPLTTSQLTEAIAGQIGWLSRHGFRYLRSGSLFRRKDEDGYSYITLNSVTHNRVDFHFAFYLGVRTDSLETAIRRIRGDTSELTHDDRSLHHYSVNTGPTNQGWRQPLAGTWTVQDISEISLIQPAISQFLQDVGLPMLDQCQTAESVRHYLMEFPGHTQNHWPWRQILGADVLAGDRARLDADFEALSIRYTHFAQHLRSDFEDFYYAAQRHI